MKRLPKSVFVNAGQGERTLTTLESHGSDSDPRLLEAAMLPMRVIKENPAKVQYICFRVYSPPFEWLTSCATCRVLSLQMSQELRDNESPFRVVLTPKSSRCARFE